MELREAVVPGYYLVCYNRTKVQWEVFKAVVPGYYLVCYNRKLVYLSVLRL